MSLDRIDPWRSNRLPVVQSTLEAAPLHRQARNRKSYSWQMPYLCAFQRELDKRVSVKKERFCPPRAETTVPDWPPGRAIRNSWKLRSEEHTSELQSQFHLVC